MTAIPRSFMLLLQQAGVHLVLSARASIKTIPGSESPLFLFLFLLLFPFLFLFLGLFSFGIALFGNPRWNAENYGTGAFCPFPILMPHAKRASYTDSASDRCSTTGAVGASMQYKFTGQRFSAKCLYPLLRHRLTSTRQLVFFSPGDVIWVFAATGATHGLFK